MRNASPHWHSMVLILVSVVWAAPSTRAIADDRPVALVGATIIDGTGAEPVPNGVVVVKNGRFLAVGSSRTVTVPAGAVRIDATGKYVIPGLMDANVHLFLDIETEPLIKYEGHYDDLIIEAAQIALRNGVTTVFDTWGPREALVRARTRINSGEAIGSRIFIAGNIIGFDGPFSDDFFQAGYLGAEFAREVNDEWEQGVGGDLLWRTPDEVRARIRQYIENGHVDFLKYGSSGHQQEQYIAFSPEAQRAIVEEGHKAGLIVQSHSTSVESLRLAIAAGVDLMQHCETTGIEPMPASTLKSIVEGHIPCAAMLKTARYMAWTSTHEYRKNFSEISRIEQENDHALIDARAVLLLTTDSGVWRPEAASNPQLSSFLKDVPDMPTQLENAQFLWLRAAGELGLSPMAALLAGTRNIAAAYGRLNDLGTIERGKKADLVVLDADPLQNPENYRAIHLVMKDGAVVDRNRIPTRHHLTHDAAPNR
ncbi:MAG TPA: amidohydrolase family protein [Steroidobacteraceae bacterium]|nr:amidohydrolase family protein [Steroidobacteraceae bacterium]